MILAERGGEDSIFSAAPLEMAMRKVFARLCRQESTRAIPFDQYGCNWQLEKTINYRTGVPFTEDEAWELLADTLEDTRCIMRRVKEMREPPNIPAYFFLISNGSYPVIYWKFQNIVQPIIYARSFHYSNP